MLRRFTTYILLIVCLFVATSIAQQKRSSMGGSAFGSLDRIPIAYLQKFYRSKNTKRDPYEFDKYMGFRDDYY